MGTAGTLSSQPTFPGLAGTGAAPTVPPKMSSDGICEVVHLTADPQTPDMMIVLDRSGSMQEGRRWMPSVSAVRRVTTELQSRIRFGLAMFPDPKVKDAVTQVTNLFDCFNQPDPQMCIDSITAMAATSVCAPGAVVVPIGASNAMAIGTALDMTQPNGGTPTSQTLEMLLTSFANAPAGPDATDVHAKYVLLVTDGQPTCPAGAGQQTTQPDIDAANKAIEALAAKDVKTYVIGYDTTGAGNEMLAAVLDGFAMRGGTGDQKHRPVEDEMSLLTELQRITGQIVGCSFTLDKPPSRADFVLVTLDGKQINLDAPDGWKLVGDRTV
ncbi:MAG TPA: vWA domain-containing protein, partial [Polyangiales bacterium]|nr:vWA domain-containing protein [Polyangiales bacterium]